MSQPLLLDTHVYVWALTAPDRLSATARTALAQRDREVLISAATVWEMAIKHRAGRWPEAEVLLDQHGAHTKRLGARSLPISSADAVRAGRLPWSHKDPFDRMLVAQALLSQAVLVSKDVAFTREALGVQVLW